MPMALNNLGGALEERGEIFAAVDCYRQLLDRQPDFTMARSNYLCALRYHPRVTPQELAEAHRQYQRIHADPLRAAWRPHEIPARRSDRCGWAWCRRASASGRSARWRSGLENLDRRQFEVVCYSTAARNDNFTARFRAASSAWREVGPESDEQLAERIRADAIDILFDLAGHAPRNRLLVFAHKPAPVQITWIDSVGTTGLAAMDYVLADRHLVPPGAESHYAEKVLRLPDDYVCYEPPGQRRRSGRCRPCGTAG